MDFESFYLGYSCWVKEFSLESNPSFKKLGTQISEVKTYDFFFFWFYALNKKICKWSFLFEELQ